MRAIITASIGHNVYVTTHCDKLYPYLDGTRDIRSNIALRLKEFPRAKPEGTLNGDGQYLTVYLESNPNTDSI